MFTYDDGGGGFWKNGAGAVMVPRDFYRTDTIPQHGSAGKTNNMGDSNHGGSSPQGYVGGNGGTIGTNDGLYYGGGGGGAGGAGPAGNGGNGGDGGGGVDPGAGIAGSAGVAGAANSGAGGGGGGGGGAGSTSHGVGGAGGAGGSGKLKITWIKQGAA